MPNEGKLSHQQFQFWKRLRARLIVTIVFVLLILSVFIVRLFYLQLQNGDVFYEKSQRVIRKVTPLVAPRGEIFDRYYRGFDQSTPIVTNATRLDLIAIPSHFSRKELFDTVRQLERALGKTSDSLVEKITDQKLQKNDEILLIEGLTQRDHTILADYYISFSKLIIRQNTNRIYHLGESGAHITGYTGPPTRKDLEKGVKPYQQVGKNGLEAEYEPILRGEDGEVIQIQTARGSIEEQKVFREFSPGNNLILTIDSEMQKIAYRSLGEKKGAIVVLKPATGEVLTMVSTPSFDPNVMISGDSGQRKTMLKFMSSERAELNRAISAKFPPASTFKPLVALAALEENRVKPSQTYHCPGKFVLKSSYKGLPDATYYDWGVHGTDNMVEAITESCSVYFYQLGYHIGPSPIIKYSRYFQLDKKTGIDLPAEIEGFVPSPLWKEKQFNQRWFDGDTINLSIGQGFIETTLIGMTNFFAAIANNGIVYRPHLVKEVRFAENDELKEKVEPKVLYELPIARSSLEVIRAGLRGVTTTGTASWVFKNPAIMPVAGKTGTVQTRSAERFASSTQHAWFIGYGPFEGNPEDLIVVGVFVEHGIGGSVGAAPVARDVFLYWSNHLREQKRERVSP